MEIRLSDFLWILAVGAVFHISFVNAILYQNIDVLPPTSPIPISLWDSVHSPVLSQFDSNTLLAPSDELNKLPGYGTDYYHPQTLSAIYGTVKAPSDVFDDNLLSGYYHNGRYLKQYFVSEENIDDINALNSFLSRFMPFVPANYNVPASKLPNLGFPTIAPPPPLAPQPTPLPNNPFNNFYSLQRVAPPPAPVQLGSGSLGYVRHPNGAVYLGSGSLGYINDRQKTDEINEARNRQSPQASPLTFGETPR